MHSIIIGFSKPIKFSLHAWIIEKIDAASFDHAYLKFNVVSLNRNLIYQANWRGVNFIGDTLWLTTTKPVEEYQLDLDDTSYNSLMQFCVDNAGISYGIFGVIGAGIVDIISRMGKVINNPFNSGLSTEFCSEIVARCLNVADPSQFNLNADNITPNDLNKLLNALNIQRIL